MRSLDEYDWPMKEKTHRPFDHQKQTVEFLIRNKRAFNLSDIGTGKTLSALWATDLLMKVDKIKRVLIVTPLSTVYAVWVLELFRNFPHRKYAVAHGSKYLRERAIESDAEYVIINHDGIKYCLDLLIKAQFDVIIIDEITAYKNHKSDRTECMFRLAKKAKAVWGMTGAITPNSPIEAYSQAKIVNPTNPYLPTYFTAFKNQVVMEIAPHVFVPKPNADKMVYAITQPSVRYVRDECLDLPPVTVQDYTVAMSEQQQEAYEDMKKRLYVQFEDGEISASNAGVKFSKLLQIAAGSVKDDNGVVHHLDIKPRMDSIVEAYEEAGIGKLIVVSGFRGSVERVTEDLQKKRFKCAYIHGDVSASNRGQIIYDFQNQDTQILVLQPQAVSHGITLTAANTIVWQSYVASGETYNQMNGRITRASQTRKQYIRRFVGSPAEKHILDILDRKMDLSSGIMRLFSERIL